MGRRITATQGEALRRRHGQRNQLAPFRFVVVAVVVVVALTSPPHPTLVGKGLLISICLCVFGLGALVTPVNWPSRWSVEVLRVLEMSLFAISAVAIAILQPHGVAELPGSVVVFIAGVTLVPGFALSVGAVVTAGVVAALAPAVSADAVLAAALLCAVLGVTGALLRRSRLSHDRAEVLLSELEEARDEQTRSAALAERAVIARDLHDLLAHSLSGLAIQLEGARQLASREEVSSELRETIDAAAAQAKQGLMEARNAVSALRQDDAKTLERIPALVEHFRRDLGLHVEFAESGVGRPIERDVSVTIYRSASEALTNVTRHALGAKTHVELSWEHENIRLSVVDEGGLQGPAGAGSGWGLAGMRERVSQIGGHLVAGPMGAGWAVVVTVPG
jgi:signal transduction histidine kinase